MVLPVLSASQLELYKLCPRRWYFTYIEGRREAPGDSAIGGTKVHSALENGNIDQTEVWVTPSGKEFPVGAIAKAMSEHIPEGKIIGTEQKLSLEHRGITYTGYIDRLYEDKVVDFKTTSALRYAKTEQELENDVQALVYAKWLNRDGELVWLYGQTKAPHKTKVVRLRILKEDVQKKFDEVVHPLAQKVLAAYSHRDKKRTHQNTDACNKFPPKGCPFRSECVEKKLNLLDSLRASVEPPVDPINSPESQVIHTPEELPKKERKKREQDATTVSAVDDAVTVATAFENPPLVASTKSEKPIGTLFVQCMPLDGRKLVHAHTLISKAAQTVENDLELHHVRLAPYNTGGASLAAQLRVDILNNFTEQFDLVLMNRSPEGREVESVLAGLAQTVIVGM